MDTTTTGDPAVEIEVKPSLSVAGGDPVGSEGGGGDDANLEAPGASQDGDEDLACAIEALLLSVDRPMSAARIVEVLDSAGSLSSGEVVGGGGERGGQAEAHGTGGKPTARAVHRAIAGLNRQLERDGRAFRIESIAGGYRVMTLARYARVVEAYRGRRERHTLSRASIETLAIIAYRQPVTRAALEAIRGVSCGEVLRSLTERRLVTVAGRAEELGRPLLYATTRQFLETFGLASIKDLPPVEEFGMRAQGVSGQTDETQR